MLPTSTLRPGFLVSLHTTISGNVSYARRDIVSDTFTADGKRYAQWETERTVNDPAEHERAEVARGAASNLIRGVCAKSAHGLLCPEFMADKLEKAIADARAIVDTFNRSAMITRIQISVLCGKIAQDDVTAMRAINQEVRNLLDAMQDGIRNFDVEKIRANAAKAKALDSMLSPAAAARIQDAVDAVRNAARRIVKAGEESALEVDRLSLVKLREARTAFLDLDDAQDVKAPSIETRGVDLTPEAPVSAPEVTAARVDVPTPETTAPALPTIGRPKAPQFALEL